MSKKSLYVMSVGLLTALLLFVTWTDQNERADKGDYIIGKEINGNNIPSILVVHDITEREAKSRTREYFMQFRGEKDLMYYHVNDIDLYNRLNVGERVTVHTAGYIMQSSPPQAVASEIIRHDR